MMKLADEVMTGRWSDDK